jgi:hypothetical protein
LTKLQLDVISRLEALGHSDRAAALRDQMLEEARNKPRKNASEDANTPLPPEAQRALNDFAKQNGYKFFDAMMLSPRKAGALLYQHESDNFGMRVAATRNAMGRWTVKIDTTAQPRRNADDDAEKKRQAAADLEELKTRQLTDEQLRSIVDTYWSERKKYEDKHGSFPSRRGGNDRSRFPSKERLDPESAPPKSRKNASHATTLEDLEHAVARQLEAQRKHNLL